MIKLVMLTGFLGTGKTTLLTAILDSYGNHKIGVIINEFGAISIDGALIEREGIQMKELSNGSIFCACIKENFISSLIAMSGEEIEYLFIEASGLADPSSMMQILDYISPKCINKYDYAGSICIVDAETFLDYYELLPALNQQVAYSGTIIVNKADLVDENRLKEVLEKIAEINAKTPVYVTSYCRVNYEEAVNGLMNPDIESVESSNTVESRPKTFILKADDILPYEELVDFLNKLSHFSYRIKGFANTTKGSVFISTVKNHMEITEWKGQKEDTQIVVISSVGIRMVSIITEGLKGGLYGKLYF